LHWPNQSPLQVNEIAQRQDIPIKFLVHILIGLKHMGLVKSARGKKGGYLLAKAPSEINLSYLLTGLDEAGNMNSSGNRKSENGHVMDLVWQEIDEAVIGIMQRINFEDICKRARASGKVLVYEI